jgi:hypothetical protein
MLPTRSVGKLAGSKKCEKYEMIGGDEGYRSKIASGMSPLKEQTLQISNLNTYDTHSILHTVDDNTQEPSLTSTEHRVEEIRRLVANARAQNESQAPKDGQAGSTTCLDVSKVWRCRGV